MPQPIGGRRLEQLWRVLRGQAVAVPHEAVKRASSLLWFDGLGGTWGEPPPISATATPLHYVQSEAVRAAVEAYANLVASTEFELHQEAADGELQELKAHEALGVLENPNEFMTRFELFGLTMSDLLLSGNAYWFLAGPNNREPSEVWRLNPRYTRLVRSKREYVAGYATEIDGTLIPLDRAEVLHFKLIDPVHMDEFYGLSKLATAALAAQTGYSMDKWNNHMFSRDYAVPAGIVAFKNMVSDPIYEQAKAEWRASYGGGAKKTAFIRGSDISFTPTSLSQTDVDFLNGSKWQAEKIYRVFGTYHLLPAQFADDRKVNERLFLEGHAWPLLIYLAEKLTDQFLTFWGPRQGTGRLVGTFEDVRPRERALDLDEDREGAKGLTFNEWRSKRNLEPVDGGDDILFVHVQSGEKVQFEVDALPEEPAAPVPPSLQPFTGQQAPPSAEEPALPETPTNAQERAELRESANNDTGDDIGESTNKTVDPAALHRELKTWRKFEMRKLDQGHARLFKADVLPPALALIIQAALDDGDDGDDIKSTFARMADLIDGKIESKASFGVPDGTVVLYLSGVEDVLLVQQVLMRSVPSDAPFRWTPVDQLHITMVHAVLVDEAPYRDIAQETGPFSALPIVVRQITTFDNAGDALPIIGLVEPSDELRALQADVWAGFAVRGIAVSEYSQPDNWQPHITLGYVDRAWYESGGNPFNETWFEFGCAADVLAFTRGNYENIYQRVATITPIAMPEVNPDDEAFKAIQATRLDFEAEFEDVLQAGRRGDIDRRAWANRTRTLLRKYGEKAYRDGLKDGGVEYGEDEPLDPEDRTALNGMLATQSQYVTELGRVVFGTERGVSDGQAAVKPSMWFNKSVLPLYQAGLVSADKNGVYSWSYNPLKENCRTCIEAAKQIHRLKLWNIFEIVPNSNKLICRGFACGCQLHRTEGRSKGRIDRIPVYSGKADHEEGDMMPIAAEWPDDFPDTIKAEFNRFLRQQVQSCIARDDGAYDMTLRESAGYYASVDDSELQRGLHMIDARLKLIARENVSDTDVRLHIALEEESDDDSDPIED